MKTVSFTVPDHVYEHLKIGHADSGIPFFSDYLKKVFQIEELAKLQNAKIKLSKKDGDIVSYFLLMQVMVEVTRRLAEEKANIKQLPKAKKEMYEFISLFTATSFMRISELNSIIQSEVHKTFGLEYDYNIQAITILIGKIIRNFFDRPVLIKDIEEYITTLARRKL